MRQRIKPVLAGRAQSFANLARVNRLFDLVVARDVGAFDDLVAVANLLRENGAANNGCATLLREISDPRPGSGPVYSSLRDQQVVRQLAAKAVSP